MFKLRRISGTSMLPTLQPGQIVLVTAMRQTYKVGDIVIIRHDGLEKIKRLQAVRADEVYTVGDNPGASTDSRQFGWINRNTVKGKMIWPKIPPLTSVQS